MPSPFTLRPKIDTVNSDQWTHSIKSHPTKDWWEHIFAAADDIYIYSADDEHTIGTSGAVINADVPSISSADGLLTNIAGYARGKVVDGDSWTYQLHSIVGVYGASYVVIQESDGWVTYQYDCTEYLDLEKDLWDLEIGGYVQIIGVNRYGVKYFDYAYAIVNYVPAPPTCVQQSIVASTDGRTLTVKNTRYEYCTWLNAWGYEVRIKDSVDILYTDTTEGVMKPWVYWEGAYNTEREIDIGDYVVSNTIYEARAWAKTEDGTGYCPWIEFSTPTAGDYPLYPVIFPLET